MVIVDRLACQVFEEELSVVLAGPVVNQLRMIGELTPQAGAAVAY